MKMSFSIHFAIGFCNISLHNNIPIQEVSTAMRHKAISTTMRYVEDKSILNNPCTNSVAKVVLL